MKIALCQQDIIWADPEGNRCRLEPMLRSVRGADLILLPEMFSTGFATSPEGIAEDSPSESADWMKKMASELDCAVAGSIAVRENGLYYNRFCFVKPSGETVTYDKKHLFTYGGEHLRFTPGKERVTVEWRGLRFRLSVCYDLRFPVWLRNRGDYDVLLCVASWPSPRRGAWDALLRARAIENQCFVAAVNRTGDDPSCSYDGGSVVIDPYGKTLASCRDGRQECVCAEADPAVLESFRKSFPVLSDRDGFKLI